MKKNNQHALDLTPRVTFEQATYQFEVAKNEHKFDLLALAKDSIGYMVFKVFPHKLIVRLGFTIVKTV